MARDIAVAAVVAFSTGVMSGVIVTSMVAIRSERWSDSLARLYLGFLERKVRRLTGTACTALGIPRQLTRQLKGMSRPPVNRAADLIAC